MADTPTDPFVDPALAVPHPDGIDLDSLDERERGLVIVRRRWSEWAKTATTDMPPDFYAGETLPDGTVTPVPLWDLSNGELVDQATWSAHEHGNGPET